MQLMLITTFLITVALLWLLQLSSHPQISDPHGTAALHHQAKPAQLPALAHGHSAREAPRGRLRHPLGWQVALGLLQVR